VRWGTDSAIDGVRKRKISRVLLLFLAGLALLGLLTGTYVWRHRRAFVVPPLPVFLPAPAYTPWATPSVAESFDFPLLPAEAYGPYVRGVTGPLAVDTRYGAQNPAMGDRANCFRDINDGEVPFSQLYHVGLDLFALDGSGQAVWGDVAHRPVQAVADGVVFFIQDAGADGHILIVEHLLADGRTVYSVYWHVDQVQVREGQPVTCGQVIAVVYHNGLNSHLHWEMRTFGDGSDLFAPGTAGARGDCNGRVAGVGYTWDDDAERALPDAYGYLDPVAFVQDHRD
jgi:hypothetical protein